MTDPLVPYDVLTVPDPRLKIKADPIDQVDDSIRRIFDRMVLTMDKEDGIGLAATQVGLNKRLIVMDIPSEREHDHQEGAGGCDHCKSYKLANPVITAHSDETVPSKEGCLSVPGQYAEVTRYQSVTISYLDENNERQTLTATGLLSDCIQHEIDHLNGILFIDYLSGIKRKMFVQKAKKAATLRQKQEKEEALNVLENQSE